ncbi:hypothetical protein LPJ64_003713 [Coemansia asiatica]|uniref:L-dopachrome isomerase n=1 Tax=Coemansia asiatica TaxID=1052880 RepID=A0A9W7XJM9_9FUNG|nr:hypothetical protein LPJ64_003713 [Coemansia asiatica]KAJ2888916.1 hypothetical protein FB639_000289 [Coemansia asiatica]
MPVVEIKTNVKSADSQEFSAKVAHAVAELLSKPLSYVMAYVTYTPSMTMGAEGSPAAYVRVGSIGAVGGSKNNTVAAGITGLLETELGIAADRVYVDIRDIARNDIALDGKTFA